MGGWCGWSVRETSGSKGVAIDEDCEWVRGNMEKGGWGRERRICIFFFFNDRATTEIYALSLHDALPI